MKTILIVDDERDLIWSISKGLKKSFKSYDILTADCFLSAKKILETSKIDILITDYRLPDGDGINLIRIAQAAGLHLPPVLMTAYGSSDLQNLLSPLHETVYLEKPFEIETLRNIIRQFEGSKRFQEEKTPEFIV